MQQVGSSLLTELEMPGSYEVENQLRLLMSMPPLLAFLDYFGSGVMSPLRKQFSGLQMQAGSILAATGQLDQVSAPPK